MPPLDPRTQRTKEALREALGKIMAHKPLAEITVSELAKAAGVNRSTFYLHYLNVSELYAEIEDELLEEFRRGVERNTVPERVAIEAEGPGLDRASINVLAETFAFLKRHQNFAPLILSESSGNRLLTILLGIGEELFLNEWRTLGFKMNQHEAGYFYIYIASGIIGLLRTWLAEGMVESPDTMAEYVVKFMTFGAAPEKYVNNPLNRA